MRRPLLFAAAGLLLVTALVIAAVVFLEGSGSTSGDGAAECQVPAVAGAPVTVVVEGPQTTGAGAAGNAAAGASATRATSVTTAPAVQIAAVPLQYASTIDAVGLARSLPQRARIIAVATAWQESGLRNLPNGDRDSVGLFQQRPSQGWGTAAQVADPVYAAGKFYDALLQVQGWQRMSLTAAAQAVQYSGFPDAYAKWEPQATTLVRELDGGSPLALTCRAGAQPPTASAISRPALPGSGAAVPALRSLLAAAGAELGRVRVVSIANSGRSALLGTSGSTPATQRARQLAAWLVAHGSAAGLAQVTATDQLWAAQVWGAAALGIPAGQVRVALA